MRAFVLYDTLRHGLYLAFGGDAVEAAKSLLAGMGEPEGDTERFSVCDHAIATDRPYDLGKLWPHFTNDPPAAYLGESRLGKRAEPKAEASSQCGQCGSHFGVSPGEGTPRLCAACEDYHEFARDVLRGEGEP